MKCWYNAVKEQLAIHDYNLLNIWNIDESGFSIGEEEVIKVLMHLDNIQKYKVMAGKQEWIIDIKCINAAGEAIAPTLIFKDEYMNTW